MSRVVKFLLALLRRVPELIVGVLIGWLLALIAIIRHIFGRYRYLARLRKKDTRTVRCQVIPPHIYKRPDPLIYSQGYLASQGLAVLWNNPDIELRRNGVPVPSSALDPDTEYEVIARIWNGSLEAPAVNMPVDFSYRAAGIGTALIPIGQTRVDLPVRGAPGHPTFAKMLWRTPAVPGHYGLLVILIWSDDTNPNNNVGQEGTIVLALNSPHAEFRFPLRNEASRARELRLDADAYRIPPRIPCESKRKAKTPEMADEEVEACWREAKTRHDRQDFPVSQGWQVEIFPRTVILKPDEQQIVTVDVTAPDDFHGRQTFNINAFAGAELVGGVTLFVEG